MSKIYMLDTNICSFIMREKPINVLEKLEEAVTQSHSIVISAITYSEILFGAINPKASSKIMLMVNAFLERLDGILPWDSEAVQETAKIKKFLFSLGTPIGNNDTAIAGHAISSGCILVTNNTREFLRVPNLHLIDWA
jgi:tRNA(fMet)-specific endonuclease VapC